MSRFYSEILRVHVYIDFLGLIFFSFFCRKIYVTPKVRLFIFGGSVFAVIFKLHIYLLNVNLLAQSHTFCNVLFMTCFISLRMFLVLQLKKVQLSSLLVGMYSRSVTSLVLPFTLLLNPNVIEK